MATSSFDRTFVVKGEAATRFLKDLETNKTRISVKRKDLNKEASKGIELLKKALRSN